MATKQKSGLYRTKVKIGVGPDGKDIVKWVSGKTKKELEDAKREVIAYYITGTGLENDKLFGEYAKIWFEHKIKGLSPSSIESYRTALNKDILPVFGVRKLRAIKPSELQRFLDGYAGMSATKITMIQASLKGIFSSACNDRILASNPMREVKKPKASEAKEKPALTEEQRARLIDVAETNPEGAYLAAMYFLGARPGEIRGLRWGDFDWDDGCVYIQRDIDYKAGGTAGDVKNRSSRRRVPVPDELRAVLTPLRGEPDSYLFPGELSGTALSKSSAEKLWVRLMLAAEMVNKLEPGKTCFPDFDIRSQYEPIITPHVLRHNYVTMCWENGIDVYTTMKLVGHKSIKTTMDIYTHLSNKQMEEAKSQVQLMFSKKSATRRSCTKVALHKEEGE